MSSVCPACNLYHSYRQEPSSYGPYSDYDICFNAIKKESASIKNEDVKAEFIKCSREFVDHHCRESAASRKANPSRQDYPIISKPLLFYRNTATDSDDWRRRND
jgi:hypothetical protein